MAVDETQFPGTFGAGMLKRNDASRNLPYSRLGDGGSDAMPPSSRSEGGSVAQGMARSTDVVRAPRPETRVDLVGAIIGSLIAVALYVAALSADKLPPKEFAPVLFAAAPVFAFASLPLMLVRRHPNRDEAVSWFGIGVFGAMVAMTLQLIGLPFVWPDGGPLGTDGDSSASLYLLFHVYLLVGALCGVLRVRRSARGWVLLAEVVLALLVAANLVPNSRLFRDDLTYTPLLISTEVALGALSFVAAFLWARDTGRRVDVIRGLLAVALALSACDLLLNALAGRRFDNVWWSSLSVRVMTYGLLATGAAVAASRQIRKLDSYTDRELGRTEGELRQSLGVNDLLLDAAGRLTQAITPRDVAEAALETCSRLTGLPRVVVLLLRPATGRFEVLAATGYDEESLDMLEAAGLTSAIPAAAVVREGVPVYASTAAELSSAFAGTSVVPADRDSAALAALPLRSADDFIGVVKISGPQPMSWTEADRELLAGVVAQVEESLERALLYERARDSAETLQRALLPVGMPTLDGVSVVARYLPGSTGLSVGGDWYDVVPTGDGRFVLVVGDVMGKGTEAAAVMGQLRTTLRALITVDPAPEITLARLDDAVSFSDDFIATLLYLLVDPVAGTAEVSRVGHLPFIVFGREGGGRLVDEAGSPPLGVPCEQRPAATIELGDWRAIALFTDGLVEERARGIEAGISEMVEAGAQALVAGASAETVADALLRVRDAEHAEDDVCLLVVTRD